MRRTPRRDFLTRRGRRPVLLPHLSNQTIIFGAWLLLAGAPSWAQEAKPQTEPATAELSDEDCLGCHGDDGIEAVTPRGKKLTLYVPEDALMGSVHEDNSCTDCHLLGDQAETHGDEGLKGKRELGCKNCHEDIADTYTNSCVHGQQHAAGNEKAPCCKDCHGGHAIKPVKDPASMVAPKNQPQTCGRCHKNDGFKKDPIVGKRRLLDRYYSSVHWKSLRAGKPAATCSDCHGSHNILPSSNEQSQVTRLALLNTCAKCHSSMVQAYSDGAHGKTLLHGNQDVPTCITCHGDHDVMSLRAQAGGSRDYAATQVCVWCHGNKRMMQRYGLSTRQVETYFNDIHGLVQKGSLGTTATCADCHDPHMAMPVADKRSRMHEDRRIETCRNCHGKVSENFAGSFAHENNVTGSSTGAKVHRFVVLAYILLILGTIGAMLAHNFVVWSYFFRRKLRYQRQKGVARRLSSGERVWHLFLLSSFFLLVFTGFAVSFSENWLYAWLPRVGITENVRGLLHRLGAVLNVGAMGVVLLWAFGKKGRDKWWRAMFPRLRDLRDFFATMRFYLMRSKERPRYALFNYAEKMEYWALWWGTVVMGVTGAMMWFSTSLPASWPSWVFDIARTVHYYEAVLAALAILVWHFFHVIYHPDEYPISTIMISGVMTEHEAHERFDDEAIAAQKIVDEPEPEPLEPKDWQSPKP